MSNYLLELGVIHVALILGYGILLRKERQYQKMRFYLIGSTLLSLIIPLLKLPKISFGQEESAISGAELQPMTVNAFPIASTVQDSFWSLELLIWIYALVSALFLLRFLANIFQIFRLEKRSSYEKLHNLYVRKVGNIEGSFTFFNWIFLNKEIDKNHDDYHIILKHEKAHVSLGHSYDLLFLELFKVCFWWVPSIWFLNKEIRKIHEYQADAYALKTYHIDQYSSILISSTLATHGLSLASSFHDGFIFKRLNAMKQKAKTVSLWKLGALTALSALLLIAFACSEELNQDIKAMGELSNAIPFDELPENLQVDLAEIKDQLSFVQIEQQEGHAFTNVSEWPEMKALDSELIHTIQFDKSKKHLIVALKKDASLFEHVSATSKLDGNVFTIVENQPEYEGGMPAFYEYVASQVKYPLEARKNDVEGTVYVQFIVEKDGILTDIKAVKGIGYGCDAEAVRVMQGIQSFSPGKQRGKSVRVRMLMPVKFKLNNEFVNEDGTQGGMIILDELTSDNENFTVETNYDQGQWTGTVFGANGKTLPGVNIVVIGTERGTVSDLQGNFSIEADQGEQLQLSFVGYASLELIP